MSSTSDHYRFVCKHGTVISQCRCFDGYTTVMDKCPPTCPHYGLTFTVGDRVKKVKGYAFDSTVVAVFQNLDGETRLVCESTLIPKMLHIFSPEQMELDRG